MLGEEHGADDDGRSGWRWIVDPIDGTANYVRGVPIWATLIAAEALRTARTALDRVTGKAGVEDMLDALFGRFCIGK